MHGAGLRAMSFGVESVSPATLKKVGRRPIPEAHQRAIVAHCRKLGIVTAAFYVLGFLEDDWESIERDDRLRDRARIDGRAVQDPDAVSGHAALQAAWQPLVTETDWEQFDGFTPTFTIRS